MARSMHLAALVVAGTMVAMLSIALAGMAVSPTAAVEVVEEVADPGSGLVTIKLETMTAGDPISAEVEFEGVDTILVDTIEDDYPLTQERPAGRYYVAITSDPDGEWEVTKIECDDAASPTPSSPSPEERMVRVGVDPGEDLTCTFTVASGEVIIKLETEPNTILGLDFVVPRSGDEACSFDMPVVPGGSSSCGRIIIRPLRHGHDRGRGHHPASTGRIRRRDRGRPAPELGRN